MSGPPDIRSSTVSTAGYTDGLGRRSVRFNREVGGMLECLHLRPPFLAFEPALSAGMRALASLEDERFARVRDIQREAGSLTVVSELVTGHRLIDILETRETEDAAVSGIDAAFGFLLQAMPALAELHARSITHGALAPGRIIITPTSQVVLLDSIYGATLERLKLNRRTLWTSFGILAPPMVGPTPIDPHLDVAQVALCALLLAAGRPPDSTANVSALAPLVREVAELAEIRTGGAFAEAVSRFFTTTLPAERRRPSVSSEEAAAEVQRLVGHISEDECLNALAELVCFQPVISPVQPAARPEPDAAAREVFEEAPVATFRTPSHPPSPPAVAASARQALPTDRTPRPLVAADMADLLDDFFARNVPEPAMLLARATPPASLAVPLLPPVVPASSTPPPPVAAAPPVQPAPVASAPAAPVAPQVSREIPPQAPPVFIAPPVAPSPPAPVLAVPVWPPAPRPFQPAPVVLNPQVAAPIQLLPAATPQVVRIRQESPEGYARRARKPDVAPAPAPPRVAPVAGRADAGWQRSTFPWKAAAAAALVLSVGFFAGRDYLQGRGASPSGPAAPVNAPVSAPANAPVAPVSAAATGSLVVNSQPSGATVILNSNVVGVTPLVLDTVATGKHQVEVTDGKITVQRTVLIEAGKAGTISVPVFSGWLAVFAPIRLDVSEGRRTLGSTESGRIVLSPGRHVLTLSNQELGYTSTQTVEIRPGEERVLNLKPMGIVNLNASPWAEVWVDGARAGETPLANLQVPLGTREFIFKHPQYGERRLTATITTSASALTVDFGRPPSRP